MGRAGKSGEAAAAGPGSGNEQPLCCPCEGTRALGPWVGTTTLQAAEEVTARRCCEPTRASVETPTGLS